MVRLLQGPRHGHVQFCQEIPSLVLGGLLHQVLHHRGQLGSGGQAAEEERQSGLDCGPAGLSCLSGLAQDEVYQYLQINYTPK